MKGGDTYGFEQLILDLQKAEEAEAAASLRQLDQEVDEALRRRNDGARLALKTHLPKLTPFLRPCHKRQGDKLTVYLWKFA